MTLYPLSVSTSFKLAITFLLSEPTVLPHIPAMVTLEALAYLARCQPQEGHGYRPVERVYLLQVGAAAGGTAGSVGGAFGGLSGLCFSLPVRFYTSHHLLICCWFCSCSRFVVFIVITTLPFMLQLLKSVVIRRQVKRCAVLYVVFEDFLFDFVRIIDSFI